MSNQTVSHVSYDQMKADLWKNGVPGAEQMTSEIIPMNGSISAANAITDPTNVKLSDTYEYYLTEIRASGGFGIAALGAAGYNAHTNLAFTLSADGRTRNIFKYAAPVSHFIGPTGVPVPLVLPAPVALMGAETLICNFSFIGNWNFNTLTQVSVLLVFMIIRSEAIKEIERKMNIRRPGT